MKFEVITNFGPLPDLLDDHGILRLLPAAAYDAIPRDALRVWCHKYARYGLPTVELVAWLRERIGDRKAIEIGSGSGDLAYHLGIPATDNRMQEWADVQLHYALGGQPVIRYGREVHRFDALEAVSLYRPDVVVASWVTEWLDPSLPAPPHGGNMYGVKEDQIVPQCEYILLGNLAVHGKKKIMALPHEELRLPFPRSRAFDPTLDRVFVWKP